MKSSTFWEGKSTEVSDERLTSIIWKKRRNQEMAGEPQDILLNVST
jgi:hypothetical protein